MEEQGNGVSPLMMTMAADTANLGQTNSTVKNSTLAGTLQGRF